MGSCTRTVTWPGAPAAWASRKFSTTARSEPSSGAPVAAAQAAASSANKEARQEREERVVTMPPF